MNIWIKSSFKHHKAWISFLREKQKTNLRVVEIKRNKQILQLNLHQIFHFIPLSKISKTTLSCLNSKCRWCTISMPTTPQDDHLDLYIMFSHSICYILAHETQSYPLGTQSHHYCSNVRQPDRDNSTDRRLRNWCLARLRYYLQANTSGLQIHSFGQTKH